MQAGERSLALVEYGGSTALLEEGDAFGRLDGSGGSYPARSGSAKTAGNSLLPWGGGAMSAYRRLVCCLKVVLIVLPGLTVYAQEAKISLSLQDAEFAQIFQTLGRLQNMNVVVDPSVTWKNAGAGGCAIMEALEMVAGLGDMTTAF